MTQRNILILGVLPVTAVIAFDFEDIYRQLSQSQKTLSLKVMRMLLKVKKKTRDQMDCQHSFSETGSKASLLIEISVIALLRKAHSVGRIKLAD